jgi:hypothetical protein
MTARASDRTKGVASRHATPAGRRDHDSPQVAESRRADESSGPGESKYASPDQRRPASGLAHADTASRRPSEQSPDRLHIELPPHAPVITPAAARALLRLVLRAAARQNQPAVQQLTPPGE